MGHLIYGNMRIEFEDRVLAHMQIVIVNKLRRAESFAVSWRDANEIGDGRSAIWVDPSIALYFKFDGPVAPDIDREWILQLANSADSSTGLIVTDRDGETVVGMPAIGIALSGRRATGANGSAGGATRGRRER
ncbi:ATP-dependent DNA ligase [Leifsonia sp. NPDC077715]|uniref:DUF7882 family protein n=1 Tax=Leifsonia sp. NPDC077715 TaxID=3155539 RepID=UPI00342B4091